MVRYCTVPQCKTKWRKGSSVKFHTFPRETSLCKEWLMKIRYGKKLTRHSNICGLHFADEDYRITSMGEWKILKKEAVPSLNLPTLSIGNQNASREYDDQREHTSRSKLLSPISGSEIIVMSLTKDDYILPDTVAAVGIKKEGILKIEKLKDNSDDEDIDSSNASCSKQDDIDLPNNGKVVEMKKEPNADLPSYFPLMESLRLPPDAIIEKPPMSDVPKGLLPMHSVAKGLLPNPDAIQDLSPLPDVSENNNTVSTKQDVIDLPNHVNVVKIKKEPNENLPDYENEKLALCREEFILPDDADLTDDVINQWINTPRNTGTVTISSPLPNDEKIQELRHIQQALALEWEEAQYRDRRRRKRMPETAEQREARLIALREMRKRKLASETPEQREARRAKLRERQRKIRAEESSEHREMRLARGRESWQKRKCAAEDYVM